MARWSPWCCGNSSGVWGTHNSWCIYGNRGVSDPLPRGLRETPLTTIHPSTTITPVTTNQPEGHDMTTATSTRRPAAKKAAPKKAAKALPKFATTDEAVKFFTEQIETIGKEINSAAVRNNLCEVYRNEIKAINSKLAVNLPEPVKMLRFPASLYVSVPESKTVTRSYNEKYLNADAQKEVAKIVEEALAAKGYTVSSFSANSYGRETWA